MATIMVFNGIFQGMGWPPSGRVLVNWFSTSERGTKVSWWNTAHNVGGALSGLLVAWGFSMFGKTWEVAFWFPAVISFVLAFVAWLLIRDNPEAEGLPTVDVYRNDPHKVESTAEDRAESTWTTIVARADQLDYGVPGSGKRVRVHPALRRAGVGAEVPTRCAPRFP